MHGYSQASVAVSNTALNAKLHFTGDTDGKPLSGARNASAYQLKWRNCTYAHAWMCRPHCVCAEKTIKPQN